MQQKKMLRFFAVFLALVLLTVDCDTLLGSYSDRPQLKEDSIVQGLVRYASQHIASNQNLALDHIKITRVQTQVVAGINYKIDFTAETGRDHHAKSVTCHTLINVQPDLSTTIKEAECN